MQQDTLHYLGLLQPERNAKDPSFFSGLPKIVLVCMGIFFKYRLRKNQQKKPDITKLGKHSQKSWGKKEIFGLLFYVVTFDAAVSQSYPKHLQEHLLLFYHFPSCVSLHCRNGHMAFTNINPDFSATKVVGGGPQKLFLLESANFFFSSILNRTALDFMIQNKWAFKRPSFDRHDMTGQHQSF